MSKKNQQSETPDAAQQLLTLRGKALLDALPPELVQNVHDAIRERDADPKLPLVHALGLAMVKPGKYAAFHVAMRGDQVVEREVLNDGPVPLYMAMGAFQGNVSKVFRKYVSDANRAPKSKE